MLQEVRTLRAGILMCLRVYILAAKRHSSGRRVTQPAERLDGTFIETDFRLHCSPLHQK